MFNLSDVSERIRIGRKNAGLTQMELANKLGVSFQAVSNWERGASMPDISNLESLADALGMTVDEVLSDKKIASIIRDGNIPDEISSDEFNAVSPLLDPEQNAELLKRVTPQSSENLNVESLCLTHGDMEKMVLEAYENSGINVFAVLVAHCSEDFVTSLIDRAYNDGKPPHFAILSAYVSDKKRVELYKRAVSDGMTPFIAILAPRVAHLVKADGEERQ